MIDLDQMDDQLAAALTGAGKPAGMARRPAPAPTPAPAVGVGELLEEGRLDEVDARIAATVDRRDRLTWTTMRDLLAGRSAAAGAGIRELSELGRAGDSEAGGRAWAQRFWAAFEWGGEAERHEVLDHCRERAYRFDDIGWWGNLTLLLAAMGKADEAGRAFDAALPMVPAAAAPATRLDVVTNLVDGAALLGDAGRVVAAGRHLRAPAGLVVVGEGVLCKGSADHYAALVHAAHGQHARATECFRRAEDAHRALGAAPLLARTRRHASTLLVAA